MRKATSRIGRVSKKSTKKMGRSAKGLFSKMRGAGKSVLTKSRKLFSNIGKGLKKGFSIATKPAKAGLNIAKKTGGFILGSIKNHAKEVKEKGIIGKTFDDFKTALFGQQDEQITGALNIKEKKKPNFLLLAGAGVLAYYLTKEYIWKK
ncbi:hypothetical protein K9M74_02660 [Candidatus Woesearchaeota archaeon]|nr:hypothetical protein [Candidatus Woesearchaeota archaeon]